MGLQEAAKGHLGLLVLLLQEPGIGRVVIGAGIAGTGRGDAGTGGRAGRRRRFGAPDGAEIEGTAPARTGRVVVEEGAVIERSVVRGPAIIGRDTVLRDTYVGPFTSIYFGCLLEDTEIEHSIVLEQSTIRGVGRIEDSLIGKEVEVSPSTALPRAHRLMLGDHSRVSIA